MRAPIAAAIAAALVIALAGCTGSTPQPVPSGSASELNGSATVFAAASLTDTFIRMADAFEAENPLAFIELNFGGSSALAQQINQGAPADVIATADTESMGLVTADITPVNFASNTLEIVVPPGNPGHVKTLSDFANSGLVVALCAAEVPCGAASQRVLDAAGVAPSVDTYEHDVKGVLTKVQFGEVDAGLVYRTDVIAAEGAVTGIRFAGAADVVNTYPIAQLSDSRIAKAFIAFVLSKEGQAILGDAGFGAP